MNLKWSDKFEKISEYHNEVVVLLKSSDGTARKHVVDSMINSSGADVSTKRTRRSHMKIVLELISHFKTAFHYNILRNCIFHRISVQGITKIFDELIIRFHTVCNFLKLLCSGEIF